MLDPPPLAPALGVAVGPVDDLHPVPLPGGDAGGEVDVVGDEDGHPVRQLEDEALVAPALQVVGEEAAHLPLGPAPDPRAAPGGPAGPAQGAGLPASRSSAARRPSARRTP